MTAPTGRPLAVVTGASSGIGYELAREFGENGFDLIIVSHGERIAEAAEKLRGSTGASVESVSADLATFEGVEQLYERIAASVRPVDALAINAGVGAGGDFARETSLEDELLVINLNVTSAVHLAKRVIPDMVRRGSGRVLFTSSVAGTMPGPYQAVYSASKAFLLSFAQAIRTELKDTGVTVTALMPGPTDTEFFDRADMADTRVGSSRRAQDDPADVARQGYEAWRKGERRVVAAGLTTKLMEAANKVTPDAVKARTHRYMAEPKD